MNVGDLVKLHSSTRRNGPSAGKLGLVVDLDAFNNPIIKVEGELKAFHYTQVEEIIYAGW
jgi:hypothetical protein